MVEIIAKNKKVSREERIICTILTIAIFAISIAGCVLGKLFTSDEALETIMKVIGGLIVFIIFFCSINQSDMMREAWMLSVAFIILLFLTTFSS